MNNTSAFCCAEMKQNIDTTKTVYYNEIFDEYGLNIMEDNLSCILIEYCPWCGKRLPISKRQEWFECLEKMGFDTPLFQQDIPQEYQCAQWRTRQE